MVLVPSLGRIYQPVVQEVSQRLASTKNLKVSDRIVLVAKATLEQQQSAIERPNHRGLSRSGMGRRLLFIWNRQAQFNRVVLIR